MPKGHAVVDGSNIATEGRQVPSLEQLVEAVKAFDAEYDFERITVIVDASFEHRVAKSERKAARTAIEENDIITPPAGVIGRGDTFILQVADRADAVVLSNDSFQEFHGTYSWLFDEGRLIGGKPIPGVGWVYVPRAPVRGPVSRRARAQAADADTPPPAKKASKKKAAKVASKAVAAAKKAGRAAKKKPADAPGANQPGVWKAFRRAHPVGSTITAEVESFSSHGAYAVSGDAAVYLPLRLLADPAPRRARDAVTVGERREFVVHRFDADRRGIDAGIIPLGASSDQTDGPKPTSDKSNPPKGSTVAAKKAAKKATKKKAPAKKAAKKKAPAKKAPAKKAAKKKAPAKKAPAKKAPAKKAPAKKAAKKSTKKAAKKAPAKKAAKKSTKKAPAKKAGAKKAAKKAPAKKAKKAAKKRR